MRAPSQITSYGHQCNDGSNHMATSAKIQLYGHELVKFADTITFQIDGKCNGTWCWVGRLRHRNTFLGRAK